MNHNKSILFFIVLFISLSFSQEIDRILPYNNVDTTGIYIVYEGELRYEKEINQSPPRVTFIFPGFTLNEGNHNKIIDLPPLYRLSAKQTINNKFYKHVRIDLNFSEIPEFKIEHVSENILRIVWSTKYVKDDIIIPEEDEMDDGEIEIWSNFDNEVSMNLRDADLVDVLRLLAMQNGMNLIANDELGGTVTLTLHDVSVGAALDAMLKVNGYDWFIQENLIVIKPIDDNVVGGLVTKHYKLEHTDAYSVGNALTNILTDKGKFQVFSPVASSSYFNSSQYNNTGFGQSGGMGSQSNMMSGNMTGGMSSGNMAGGAMGARIGGMGGNQQGGLMNQNPESTMTADHLLVTDVYSNFDHIESVIKKLDKPVPQINISVKFIETKLDVEEKLGIDWNLRAEMFGPTPDPNSEVADFGNFKLFNTDNLSLYSINIPAFESVLELLASDGETRLMQEPQLTTKNNTVATFKVGTTYPTLVAQTTEVAQTISYEDKEINIILNVQPRVNDNTYVSMDISTTVQALVGYTGENGDQPIISNRASTTHVRVEDQRTLMIGGLIFDQAIENKTKVPFISSIPLLGKLFTHTNYTTEQRELLIFITPSIIKH